MYFLEQAKIDFRSGGHNSTSNPQPSTRRLPLRSFHGEHPVLALSALSGTSNPPPSRPSTPAPCRGHPSGPLRPAPQSEGTCARPASFQRRAGGIASVCRTHPTVAQVHHTPPHLPLPQPPTATATPPTGPPPASRFSGNCNLCTCHSFKRDWVGGRTGTGDGGQLPAPRYRDISEVGAKSLPRQLSGSDACQLAC